jgi:hypothetical protein
MILASNELLGGATTEIMVHLTVVLLGPAPAAERNDEWALESTSLVGRETTQSRFAPTGSPPPQRAKD